nr:hypothetical protein [Oscillatoria sp. PCC 10802]
MSPEPQANTAKPTSERQRASQQPISTRVIAAAIGGDTSTTDSQPGGSGLLYQGSEPLKTETFNRQLGGDKSLLEDVGEMPAQRQPVFNRSDPNAKLLERAGAVFQDASGFLKDRAENPADKSHS